MTSDTSHTYAPANATRIVAGIFTIPGAVLFGWIGIKIIGEGRWWGLIFMFGAALLAIWLVFITTIQVKINGRELVRKWALGSRAIPVAEITRLTWSGGRTLFLVIGTREKRVMLSTQSFKKPVLREIASAILAARGLAGRPLWPPYATYIDVEEMARRYLGPKG